MLGLQVPFFVCVQTCHGHDSACLCPCRPCHTLSVALNPAQSVQAPALKLQTSWGVTGYLMSPCRFTH